MNSKVIADLLKTVGIDHVITVDLHTEQPHIFFEKSIHNLNTTQLFLDHMTTKMSSKKINVDCQSNRALDLLPARI